MLWERRRIIMEPPKIDVPKLPDMVMCGDHPSFTKTELNVKEIKTEEKKAKEKTHMSYARLSPSSSRADGVRSAPSEAALRLLEARRRARSLDVAPRPDADLGPGNRALVQAALGSFRWPPYLLCVWVVVLVLTHVLHCLVTVLEKALPNLKKFCLYFRTWTEEMWKMEGEINHRLYPIMLAFVTGMMYMLYFGLYVLYSVALWSIEPLCSDIDETKSSIDMEAKVTNYDEGSKTNSSIKP